MALQRVPYTFQKNGYFINDFGDDVIRHIAQHSKAPPDIETVPVTSTRAWRDMKGRRHSETTITQCFHRLLIMDNSPVHHSIEGAAVAEEHMIHIIFLPPNLTHLMQVSNVSVFSTLKKGWYGTQNEQLGATIVAELSSKVDEAISLGQKGRIESSDISFD